MYADVILKANNNQASVVVPAAAVVTSTERKYVLVVRNHKTVKVDVSTIAEVKGKVAVTGLLEPGEQVVTNANDEIKEGIAVN